MYRTLLKETHEIYEAITTYRDITERQQILSDYRYGKHLDRDHAVRIIYDLRSKEPLDFFAWLRKLPYGAWPTEVMSDQYICGELSWQIEYLQMKCLSKAAAPLFQNYQEAPHANP